MEPIKELSNPGRCVRVFQESFVDGGYQLTVHGRTQENDRGEDIQFDVAGASGVRFVLSHDVGVGRHRVCRVLHLLNLMKGGVFRRLVHVSQLLTCCEDVGGRKWILGELLRDGLALLILFKQT